MKAKWFAALCAVVLLAGCAGSTGQEDHTVVFHEPQYEWGGYSDVTLQLWTQEREMNRNYMRKALSRYQETTGNRVEIVDIPKNEFEQRVSAALAGEGEAPDLLLSYGGTNIDAFQPDRNFYDFTGAPWVDDLTAVSINQTVCNGRVIGLPHWEASVSGTLYNKQIFRKYGIEIPETQEEFLAACDKLLQNGLTPLYMPYAEVSMLLYQFPLDTLVQDSERLAALNRGELGYADIPEMKAVLEWYRTMAQKGYLGEDYAENDWDGMDQAMKSGDYAMMLCWDTWLYTDFTGEPSQFGLMPAFVGVPEKGAFEGPNLALLLVNQNSPQAEAAADFITFMADPYNYNAAFEGIYTAPVFKNQAASISTPQYVEAERLIEKNFYDSTAWLRIRGFSQMDAYCIQKYMDGEEGYTAEQCLAEMEALRKRRF